MNRTLLFLLFCLPLRIFSQNLVPNPDFESKSGCPSGPGQYQMSDSWFSANSATPDYFNDCSSAMEYGTEFNSKGGQVPHSGHGYMGIVSENLHQNPYYEYLETELKEPLKAGEQYCIRMYVSLGNSTSALREFGAVFSQTRVKVNNPDQLHLPFISVSNGSLLLETDTWICIKGTYPAKGGERFLTLGDFGDENNLVLVQPNPKLGPTFRSAYYFIDDIAVEQITPYSECQCP
jgi:OmpA-OmpF porin, OOP family